MDQDTETLLALDFLRISTEQATAETQKLNSTMQVAVIWLKVIAVGVFLVFLALLIS